ncbi:hypothetical protein MJO28_003173 [Puccinia striiformis f. sp. tritici]|uniref:Uncharacterized protein n=1 Tax=Puccinia striiformis f. sp. tritici TaxID=168172 RepID=A0ACC0ERY5_9BASI|nr:hypothetical protein MJO28_003173 [Puccinia striiformis f. sp. tritici]
MWHYKLQKLRTRGKPWVEGIVSWLALDGNATPFTHRLAKPDRLPSWIISGSLTNWHNADRALRAPTLVSSPVATGLLRNSLRIRRLTKSYGAP